MRRKIYTYLLLIVFFSTLFNVFIPSATVKAETTQPTIVGKTAITIDMQTGEIIYAKGVDERMFPASTTKLMTALLFSENKDRTDAIEYTETAKAQPAFSLSTDVLKNNIKVGDTMTADDVMEALLIFSANDSAYMISDSVAGDVTAFAKMMNEKAASLGLKNTNFVTPNGLHDDNHYTTAYDLSVIARAAFKVDWIKEVLATSKAKIENSEGAIAYIENRNKTLGQDGNLGGKTGYTSDAGKCLVALYERDGRQIVGVVMKSTQEKEDTQVFEDMKAIMDYSYAAEPVTVYAKGAEVKTETVTYKAFRFFGPEKTIEVPLTISEDATYYDNYVNKKDLVTEVSIDGLNPWKLSAGEKAGTVTFKEREVSKSYDLTTTVSSGDLFRANLGLYAVTFVGILAGVFVILLIIRFINKGRSRRRRNSSFKYR